MKLLGQTHIDAFKAKHATSRSALDALVQIIKAAIWKTPNDVKLTLGARADHVGKQTVLDAGGNKARLITKIEYATAIVLVTHVLDHKEYDKGKWKEK